MKDRVVCISEDGFHTRPWPIKGEIYTLIKQEVYKGRVWNLLKGWEHFDKQGKRQYFIAENFRPVDDTFGEWVEETLMKEVQIEELINA